MKGQVAFESLFIVLVIMTAAIYITMLYMNTNEPTVATAIVRDELFSQALDMNSNVLLKYVHINRNASAIPPTTTIEITTDPGTLRSKDFNWADVNARLSRATSITSFMVSVNGVVDANPK